MVLTCPVRMLRIRMTEGCESRGNWLTPVYVKNEN